MKPKVIDGVTFYPAAVEGKTEAEFIAHESHHGMSKEQLKEVYSRMSGKKEESEKSKKKE